MAETGGGAARNETVESIELEILTLKRELLREELRTSVGVDLDRCMESHEFAERVNSVARTDQSVVGDTRRQKLVAWMATNSIGYDFGNSKYFATGREFSESLHAMTLAGKPQRKRRSV